MSGQLSALYSEFLEGGYDCVDRVVSNAYFSMGQLGGGFRRWWRELYGSRFSRRLRAWAKANGVPVIYWPASTLPLSEPARALHAFRLARLLAHLAWTLSRGSDQRGYPRSPPARCRI